MICPLLLFAGIVEPGELEEGDVFMGMAAVLLPLGTGSVGAELGGGVLPGASADSRPPTDVCSVVGVGGMLVWKVAGPTVTEREEEGGCCFRRCCFHFHFRFWRG